MKGRLQRALNILLHIQDTPHRIALSFAIGVSIAFNPLLGLHTLLALLVAFALRLSRVAMLLGAFINNPWTIAPLYMAGTIVGCALLGVPSVGLSQIDWSLDASALWDALSPFLWPFVIGNLVLGALCALPAYFLMRRYLERRAARAAVAEAQGGNGI
jgi:uncharacterized protein (DUF2062 family)